MNRFPHFAPTQKDRWVSYLDLLFLSLLPTYRSLSYRFLYNPRSSSRGAKSGIPAEEERTDFRKRHGPTR